MGRFVVTGSLTGGHVMPCITIALALQERGHRILYIGADDELEAKMCREHSVDFAGFRYCRHSFLRRRLSLLGGIVVALATLRKYRPDAVFSKGSLVSIPVVFAAKILGVPVILHESDAVPGSETRLLARYCDQLCSGFQEAADRLRRPCIVTGNVPRPNFSGGDKHHCLRNYGIGETKPVLFVTGGSQGADSLNRLVFRIAGALTRRYYVIHQCGVGKVDKGVSGHDYVQVEFVDDEIRHIYAATDLVVSRAGATAIAEISMYRVPALYIPYPWAEGDHQRYNASIAATRGGCEVLSQEGLTPERLLLQINEMMARRLTYRASYATCDQAEALPRLLDIIERYAAS